MKESGIGIFGLEIQKLYPFAPVTITISLGDNAASGNVCISFEYEIIERARTTYNDPLRKSHASPKHYQTGSQSLLGQAAQASSISRRKGFGESWYETKS